mgnify:CR=1 FL=1|jgi:hypothetical protein
MNPIQISESNQTIIIDNPENYIQDFREGKLYIIPKVKDMYRFKKKSLSLSQIIYYHINYINGNLISSCVKTYTGVLINIWKSMSIQKILQNTTFNIKLGDLEGEDSYIYHHELKFSFQHKGSNKTFEEIVNMINLNNYEMELKIKLYNGDIIEYNF